jgi:hydroxylamine reductase
MFCFQCEQTVKGQGCTTRGVCGKDPTTAALQDLLVYGAKGLSMWAHRARQLGAHDEGVDIFANEVLFATVTNVDFDPTRLVKTLQELGQMMDKAQNLYESAAKKAGRSPEKLSGPAAWRPKGGVAELEAEGRKHTIESRRAKVGPDVCGVEEMIMYGLKGMAAYVDHAQVLGYHDEKIYAFTHECLDFLSRDNDLGALVPMALKVGEMNIATMALLDRAHTTTYGHPVPTKVPVTTFKGKAILVSGHDLKDLEELLKQTQGKGVNIYTHGEMLPAHSYPELKKYKHLVGNYGGAWQDQQKEFEAFPGAILMTTNCIQAPRDSYKARIFTAGLVAFPGVRHIQNREFGPVIEAALQASGFSSDEPKKEILIGFGHNTVMSVADKVIDGVKQGKIRHFFLIGGCDGAKPGRNYYTELAEKIPNDCVILTVACGKYRFNKLEFGDIGGIPRLLDVGQCNDAYSAVQIALALSKAFNTDVNSLPLSLVLSWYEQKAVAILLSLLHLGIKNIRLGPSLPAFVTPAVLDVLVKNFAIKPITTADEDLKAILG